MSLRSELIQVAAVAVAAVTDLDAGTTLIIGNNGLRTHRHKVVMSDVEHERFRQEAKWGERHIDAGDWMMILAEEVGESADEINWLNADHDPAVVRSVLQHLSIAGEMARAWLESKQP